MLNSLKPIRQFDRQPTMVTSNQQWRIQRVNPEEGSTKDGIAMALSPLQSI